MTVTDWLFDGVLVMALLGLGWRALFARELFGSVLSFIALGMFMALAWVRLQAPDVALAEAILGGGMTGALLLVTLQRLGPEVPASGDPSRQREVMRPSVSWFAILAVAAVTGVLIWALWSMPAYAPGLSVEVRERLVLSGVRAAVTAVLLNFRGYDTLLELAVLLAALLSIWYISEMRLPRVSGLAGPVAEGFARMLVPLMVLLSVYLLWRGEHAAGGAFHAGALLAAAAILVLVIQPRALPLRDCWQLRFLLVAGPAVFVLVAGGVMLFGNAPLQYPLAQAGGLILVIEVAAMFSIGLALLLLFAGGRPAGDDER